MADKIMLFQNAPEINNFIGNAQKEKKNFSGQC